MCTFIASLTFALCATLFLLRIRATPDTSRALARLRTQQEEMRADLIGAKKRVASSIADQKRVETWMRELQDEIEQWEKKALMAERAGRPDLAEQARAHGARSAEQARELQPDLDARRAATDRLRLALQDMSNAVKAHERGIERAQVRLEAARSAGSELSKRELDAFLAELDLGRHVRAFQAGKDAARDVR